MKAVVMIRIIAVAVLLSACASGTIPPDTSELELIAEDVAASCRVDADTCPWADGGGRLPMTDRCAADSGFVICCYHGPGLDYCCASVGGIFGCVGI